MNVLVQYLQMQNLNYNKPLYPYINRNIPIYYTVNIPKNYDLNSNILLIWVFPFKVQSKLLFLEKWIISKCPIGTISNFNYKLYKKYELDLNIRTSWKHTLRFDLSYSFLGNSYNYNVKRAPTLRRMHTFLERFKTVVKLSRMCDFSKLVKWFTVKQRPFEILYCTWQFFAWLTICCYI